MDFYEFDISFLDPNILPTYPFLTYPTVFDLDYANGLTDRPNASMQVYRLYDVNGTPEDRTDDIYRLVYTARDGNVAEDLPATPGASDLQDMLRGSVGGSDPFLGVVDLAIVQPTGEPFKPYPHATFRVAVSPDIWMPDDLNQFTSAIAANPDLRLEPIETVRRIAEDHIEVGNTVDQRPIPDPGAVGHNLGSSVPLGRRRPVPDPRSGTARRRDVDDRVDGRPVYRHARDRDDGFWRRDGGHRDASQRLAVFVSVVAE